MESVSLVYAKALFSLALEERVDKEIFEEINDLHKLIVHDKSFVKLMDSRTISKEEKKQIIDKIFKDKISVNLLNFLKLLIDKFRFNSLEKICLEYKNVYYEHYGIKEAKIYSAMALSKAKLAELKESLEKKYNCEIILEPFIDESLLAGLKVVIGDIVIDGSVSNRLVQLKRSITLK